MFPYFSLQKAMRHQFKVVMHKITPALENLLHLDFEISEHQFADYDINDPFANNFIIVLQKSLANCKEMLLDSCFDRLLVLVAEHMTLRMEKFVLQKRFTFVRIFQCLC
jgi:hypothetical protein